MDWLSCSYKGAHPRNIKEYDTPGKNLHSKWGVMKTYFVSKIHWIVGNLMSHYCYYVHWRFPSRNTTASMRCNISWVVQVGVFSSLHSWPSYHLILHSWYLILTFLHSMCTLKYVPQVSIPWVIFLYSADLLLSNLFTISLKSNIINFPLSSMWVFNKHTHFIRCLILFIDVLS